MSEEVRPYVEVNRATASQLTALPGMGLALAERIVAGRPYHDLSDLLLVKGVGKGLLALWAPHLSLSNGGPPAEAYASSGEAEPPSTASSAEEKPGESPTVVAFPATETPIPAPPITPPDEPQPMELGLAGASVPAEPVEPEQAVVLEMTAPIETPSPVPAPEPPAVVVPLQEAEPVPTELPVAFAAQAPVAPTRQAPEAAPIPVIAPAPEVKPGASSQPAPQTYTRRQVLNLVVLGGLVSLLAAILLTLGVLANLNQGQLQFVLPSQASALETNLASLAEQNAGLERDLAGLQARLTSLEALGGRITGLEQANETLRADLDESRGQMETLSGELQTLTGQLAATQAELEALRQENQRFTNFLAGLRALLDGLSTGDK